MHSQALLSLVSLQLLIHPFTEKTNNLLAVSNSATPLGLVKEQLDDPLGYIID